MRAIRRRVQTPQDYSSVWIKLLFRMITATTNIDGPPVRFNAALTGLAVYLDNFALINLAKGDSLRRQRFISTLHRGADLLFSVSNVVELTGPQGKSLADVRAFLDEIGPHWFPVELDATEVVNREVAGARLPESCICTRFVKDYFAFQMAKCVPNSGRIINLSRDSLGLGAVLDWVGPQRKSICDGSAALDAALVKKITGYRNEFERNPAWLDQRFPILPFNPDMPATFTYVNLVRTLIVEAKAHRLKEGDGLDFCHAVIATSFASVATLDKQWKRRIESLTKPNTLAPVYYGPQLDEMVTDIECRLTPMAK